MSAPPPYSIVIATKGRSSLLADTVADLARQSAPPAAVLVVDSTAEPSGDPFPQIDGPFATHYTAIDDASAARQRNSGARQVDTPLICFLDDDVRLPPDLFQQLLQTWETDRSAIGVNARINGLAHPPPGRLLHAYYRWQAGYAHPTYGTRLFGPAINCVPTYDEPDQSGLIPGQFLNSTCMLIDRAAFTAEGFPDFHGYSWGEDVHLSSRLARHGPVYFHKTACYDHLSPTTREKSDLKRLGTMQMTNQFRIATECMEQPAAWTLRRLRWHLWFVSIFLLRSGRSDWREFLKGGKHALSSLRRNP